MAIFRFAHERDSVINETISRNSVSGSISNTHPLLFLCKRENSDCYIIWDRVFKIGKLIVNVRGDIVTGYCGKRRSTIVSIKRDIKLRLYRRRLHITQNNTHWDDYMHCTRTHARTHAGTETGHFQNFQRYLSVSKYNSFRFYDGLCWINKLEPE